MHRPVEKCHHAAGIVVKECDHNPSRSLRSFSFGDTTFVGMHHNVATHIVWGLDAKQLRKIFPGVFSTKHSGALVGAVKVLRRDALAEGVGGPLEGVGGPLEGVGGPPAASQCSYHSPFPFDSLSRAPL